MNKTYLTIIISTLLLALGTKALELPPLFDEGTSVWAIHIAENSEPAVLHAVTELTNALFKVSGSELQVKQGDIPAGAYAIVVGDLSNPVVGAAADALGLALGDTEQIAVKTIGSTLYLAGNQPRGALYAVYSFLNRQLGVRWLWPGEDGEFMPRLDSWRIPQLSYNHTPGYRYRGFHLCGDWRDHQAFRIWMGRNFINIHRHAAPESERKLGFHSMHSAHYAHLSAKKYFDDHPEYFAEIGGHRYPSSICLTNPKVLELVVEEMRQALKLRPQIEILNIYPSDSQDYCRCAECAKMSVSTAWFSFHNRLTDILKAEYPQLQFATIAYQGYKDVPECEVRNVIFVEYATYSRCNIHPYNHPDCPRNEKELKDIEKWEATGVPIGNYGYEFDIFRRNPRFTPFFTMIADAIREGHRRKQVALITEVSLSPKTGPITMVRNVQYRLPIYLYAQLMWDPDSNLDGLLADWCQTAYGEAAPYLLDYFQGIDQAWDAMDIHRGILGDAIGVVDSFLTPELQKRAEENFNKATATLAAGPPSAKGWRALEALERERVLFKQWQDLAAIKSGEVPLVNAPLLKTPDDLAKATTAIQHFGADTHSTQVRVAWTKEELLLHWLCNDPDTPSLRASATEHDGDVLGDDAVTVEISTGVSGESYLLALNSRNTRYDLLNTSVGTKDINWNPEWRSDTEIKPGLWEVTMAIPFSSFSENPPQPHDVWEVRLGRTSGGHAGRAGVYFPAPDSLPAMLLFNNVPATGRQLLYWGGYPSREQNRYPAHDQAFIRGGWQMNICTNLTQIMALHPEADAYYFRHANGEVKVPDEYWPHLAPAISNGAVAVFSSYLRTPVDRYLGNSRLATKSTSVKGLALPGRKTISVTEGPWGTQPNNVINSLMRGYSPAYGVVPVHEDTAWTVLAVAPSGHEPFPYILAVRIGKGLVVQTGDNVPAPPEELLNNLVEWNRRMLESLPPGTLDTAK